MIIKDFTWDEIREIMYEGRGGRRNLIAIDTNIWFARLELTKSAVPWAIPWPCIHEFFGVIAGCGAILHHLPVRWNRSTHGSTRRCSRH